MGLIDLKRAEYKLRQVGHAWFPVRAPKWLQWLFAVLTVMVYGFVFYHFFVSPLSLRWKGLFGDTFPAGYSIRGIDISHYQGRIDWKKLRHALLNDEPVSFVLMKATEGTDFLDEYFLRNMEQAKDAGFICGAYHFFLPSEPAEAQAKYFIENAQLEDGDFPPVLDFEHRGRLTAQGVRDAALAWLKIVEAHYGVKPIIYTNYKFKLAYLSDTLFDAYPYWIAHYYVDSLKYEGKWKLWQYTDNGQLDGITGRVDFNLYNGSMYDLHKFLIGHREENEFYEEEE
ncbi:MAG: glycoside hydrolase family 25 protein [Bacteroidaceae bacterium]|nr:glycoside hydrolase family 25 protein [Bacteroidaceae bacterium]